MKRKQTALELKQILAMIPNGDPNEIGSLVKEWELQNEKGFPWPNPVSTAVPEYLHPGFGWVQELR